MNLSHADAITVFISGFLASAAFDLIRWLISRCRTASQAQRPRPIDEAAPPVVAVYEQTDGEPERCDCHGRPLVTGEEILIWPQRPQILCSDETRRT